MLNDYEAIIFDLDGTLIDSTWIWKDIDVEFLGKRNIEMPEGLNEAVEGMSFTEVAEYFKERFKLEESIEEIKDEWHEMADDYYRNRIQLKEGVRALLKEIEQLEKPMGIGTSNSRALAEMIIHHRDIKNYFKTVVTSCDVNKGKPSPDVFLKVAELLDVNPKKCLVFEDTFAGVKAAKEAGMDVFAIFDEASEEFSTEIKALADQYLLNYQEIL